MSGADEPGECPVSPEGRNAFVAAAGRGCPIHETAATADSAPTAAGGGDDGPLTRLNAMPAPDQTRAANQKAALSTERSTSSIPRAIPDDPSAAPKHQADLDESNWVYPSQQMFYNAMKKKGWNPEEETMPSIIGIHNDVNERCWKQILVYESLHTDACCDPKLARFRGRFNDPTPKARVMALFGFKAFDRHDWVVDRCGEEVRYVIDYYSAPGTVAGGGGEYNSGVHIDARPALDSVSSVLDRARVALRSLLTNIN